MARQAQAQKIGTIGETIVSLRAKESGIWIARNLTEDYGVDLELEYSKTILNGSFVKVQVKTKAKVNFIKGFANLSIRTSFAKYCYECRVPILLVLVCADTSRCWYVWMQKWIIENNFGDKLSGAGTPNSLTIHVPIINEFCQGLKSDIVAIANWENNTQLFISLRDLANLSVKLYNDQLARVLFSYLENAEEIDEPNYVSTLINQALALGNRFRGTPEGNKVAQMLYSYVRKHGKNITAQHIVKLIVRDDVYSRVGITVLGLLYDCYPSHAKSLELVKLFEESGDELMEYYCAMRERYLGMESPRWLNQKDLLYRGLQPDFGDVFILDKWANRGDSVLFDYLDKVN